MFFKQSGYKPRTNSQSSGKSGSFMAGSPPKEEAKPAGSATGDQVVSAAVAGRRRSSASSADKFAGLQGQKRSSVDTNAAKWAEQKPGQTGILGGMWNSFTKGG
ncbi:uncharacterized protein A1O9_00934 [Exophiala aquamarina CBS 119918]|uniref:Uncharacterized protein n=1 Tax=Exophiala aquamarina CBS 119918 TaxID=1182545 RepID=A0A072PS82_9EURO|nr:uncharacterized protein A1O9_00934 [Exophiala aquamarina CBS 119918]KEF62959.1 hypothetical protein A1O9_00934 [Exophiala aquamarina CBS 119918]